MMDRRRGSEKRNYYRKNNRGIYSRGSSSRGRSNYRSRRGYSRNNDPYYNQQWERSPPRSAPRPLSPVEGSEEFTARKIQQTSAIIMRQLLSPDEPIVSPLDSSNKNNEKYYQNMKETEKLPENKDKQVEKASSKTKKSSSSEINVREIHDKIMNRIINFNEGRKKNFINAHNNTSWDGAIQHISKQRRLELSRVFRDMCSSMSTNDLKKSEELINSLIPDIGMKIEELPIEVIERLRHTLNLDLDEGEDEDELETCTSAAIADRPITSDELSAAVNSIQVKTEEIEPTSYDSVEIKQEDILDYDDLKGNTNHTSKETGINQNENHTFLINEDHHDITRSECLSLNIKTEPTEYDPNSSRTTFSENTVVFSNNLRQESQNETIFERNTEIGSIDHEQIHSVADIITQNTNTRRRTFSENSVAFANNQRQVAQNETISERNTEIGNTATRQENTREPQNEAIVEENAEIGNTDHEQIHSIDNIITQVTDRPKDSISETEHSTRSFEDFVTQFLEYDNLDISDVSQVVKTLKYTDRCIQHLVRIRGPLVDTLANHSCQRTGNREGIGTSQNYNINDYNRQFRSQAVQTTDDVILEDEDKRIFKRRKVVNNVQYRGQVQSEDEDKRITKRRKTIDGIQKLKEQEKQIKSEENDSEELEDILTFPKLDNRVTVIESVNNKLILATESGNIIYASLKDGTFLHTIDVSDTPITSIIFLRGLNNFIFMYVGSMDLALRIYHLKNREIIKTMTIDDSIRCMDTRWDYVFMGCRGGTLIRYSCEHRKVEFTERTADAEILVIKAAQEGPRKILLVGHKHAPIFVRDALSGLHLRNFDNHAITPTVYSLVINKSELYCGTAQNNILIYSFHEGKVLAKLTAADCKGISCMKIYRNLLFSGCYNGSIYIYRLNGKKLLTILKGPGGSISCMEILSNQVIVGTLTGKLGSVAIPEEVMCYSIC